jgi:hypothetical protein
MIHKSDLGKVNKGDVLNDIDKFMDDIDEKELDNISDTELPDDDMQEQEPQQKEGS